MPRTPEDEKRLSEAAERVFAAMPDPPIAYVTPFNHAAACGIVVRWAAKGVGFGEITIAIDKHGDTESPTAARVDAEAMGVEFVGRMLMALKGVNQPEEGSV